MTLIHAPKVTKIICTGFSRPYYPSSFPQRQQNPQFGAVAEAAFPMYPLYSPCTASSLHSLFHNGSKTLDSVPLRKPLSPCTLSTAPVRHLSSVSLFHNGSKIHDSVPLRRPLSPCTLSTAPVRHLPSASPFHNGSKIHDSVPLRKPPSICNGCYFAKQQKLRELCRSLELQIQGYTSLSVLS